ncbi:hypothetical protein BDP27DRAFT_1432986 [Rhodocollybia butyracea]|uniref:Uncharacterized protein n=1 Tax=Rhodocollybia butyracea TaxID=206335 RepID=A0A9P5TYF5_9AGAR|nr:hypothetical protein BDP27DRAFT_1432986 [Rhodocollybia butyracea]
MGISNLFQPNATFNITLAQAQGGGLCIPRSLKPVYQTACSLDFPESSASASSSTSTAPLSSTPPSSASTAPLKPTAMISSSNTSKKTELGAIVGGVIGTLTLLGLGLWLWKRTRHTEQKQRTVYITNPYTLTDEDNTGQLTTIKRGKLQQRSEELVQSMRELQQSQVTAQPVSESSDLNAAGTTRDPLQTWIQAIETRMENLTTEMSRYIQPPAYENGTIV